MDDALAGGAPGGGIAGSEFNGTALLALGAEAGSGGAGLLGGAEKLACSGKENSPTVGATVEGAGAIGSSPLFAAAPNQFACQVAGAAERADSSSCPTTDSSLELDGGPGGSDIARGFRRDVDRLERKESSSDAESSDWTCTLTWWDIICRSILERSREMRRLARSREMRRKPSMSGTTSTAESPSTRSSTRAPKGGPIHAPASRRGSPAQAARRIRLGTPALGAAPPKWGPVPAPLRDTAVAQHKQHDEYGRERQH